MATKKNRPSLKAGKQKKAAKAIGAKNVKPSKLRAAKAVKKHVKKAKVSKTVIKKPVKIKLTKEQKAEARAKEKARVAKEKQLLEEEEKRVAEKLRQEQEKIEIARLNVLLGNTYARQFLVDLAGENTLAIMKSFVGRISDEELSKKLKIKISDVRATLNKLHCEGLVSYVREKDNETGWFSYSWALNREKIEHWVTAQLRGRNPAVFEENVETYFCPHCGVESVVSFEMAAAANFKCAKCERNLEYVEHAKVAKALDEIISKKK